MFRSGRIQSPAIFGAAAAGGGDAAVTTAFLARTSGLDATHTNAYKTLLNGLNSDGVVSKLIGFWVPATQDQTTAKLNLISSSFTLIEQGTPTWTADQGYTGNGSSMYLDTQCGAVGSYTQNSASYGAYLRTNSTGDNSVAIGAYDSTIALTLADILTRQLAGTALSRINDAGGGSTSYTNATRAGMYVNTRTGASAEVFYKNGTSQATGTATSQSVATLPSFFILARNDGGTASSFSLDQVSSAFIGGALTATDALNLSNRINAFLTTLGTNVY